jgi:lipopolysaccharide transport system permease protein
MPLIRGFLDDARELWSYRSLLYMLVLRDLKSRYRGSVLGIAWSFLQPLGMMLVMTFAFRVATPVAGMANPHVFILSGLLAWNFFVNAVIGGSGSVLNNAALVKKVYFPRILLPVSAVTSALINYLFALPVFVVVAVLSGHPVYVTLVLLPLVLLIQTVLGVGIALLLSTLNVFYRDTQFIVELSMTALLFLTPIFYDIAAIAPPNVTLWLRRLNPMASIVNMYQDVMYWGVPTTPDFVIRTAVTAGVVLVIGYLVFRRFSPRFGEEV